MKMHPASISLVLLSLFLSGCVSHDVKFQNASYSVLKSDNASSSISVVAVISPQTLAEKKTISSWMTGIAHKWDAQPGEMLKDVVAIEFPQAFGHSEIVAGYSEPTSGDRRGTIELSVPSYDFSDFHATITVHAIIFGPGRDVRSDKTYSAEGVRQGAKMFWAGAFGMKSAIRQSSLDAYKKIFAQLRPDIERALAPIKSPATQEGPNKSPEPTSCTVMPRATVCFSDLKRRIGFCLPARVTPAQAVAHL